MAACALMLMHCGAMAGQQAGKKIPQSVGHTLWHRLETMDISEDHKWVLYKSATEESDTLIVQSATGGKRHSFPNAGKAAFFGRGYLVANGKKGIEVLHLKTGRRQPFKGAADFAVAGELLGMIYKNGTSERLSVVNHQLTEVESIDKVVALKEHAASNSIAVTTIDGGNATIRILQSERGVARRYQASFTATNAMYLTWSNDGKNIAFAVNSAEGSKLYAYSLADQKLWVLEEDLLDSMELAKNIELQFSGDGQRLYFKGRSRNAAPRNSVDAVQVWNAADKWIYPAEQAVMGFSRYPMLLAWEPKRHKLLQIADTALPNATLLNDNYALLSNPKAYEPQERIFPPVDLYLADLSTGSRKLLLKNQPGTEANLYASPEGTRFAYFKEGNWWVYTTVTDSHSNLSDGFSVPLGGEKNDWSDLSKAYGFGGWTPDGKSFVVYDEFDLWQVAADGSRRLRLTQGRETSMIYRILWTDKEKLFSPDAGKPLIAPLQKGLLLTGNSQDHHVNGIYRLDKSLKIESLYVAEKKIHDLLRKGDALLWVTERYDLAPQLLFKKGSLKPKTIVRSNTHAAAERRMDVLHYTGPKGQSLKGLLYYPFGYEAGKKYPLIANVYEVQSDKLHQYVMPSLRDGRGFSVGNYLEKGYFVLLPDIAYEFNSIGQSALQCVEAALDECAKVAAVDMSRLGLIGQSFGGYETSFIVTQTHRFACAVAGAAATNLVSGSLAVARNNKRPNFFKFEGGQYRMLAPATEDVMSYVENSPVTYARNVATPLLSWTGLEDTQVESLQSFEMYMAMRRMKKEHVMLAYPNEGHELDTARNIADLYQKIADWFDHYLEGAPKAAWMYPAP